MALANCDIYDFLIDIVPREEVTQPGRTSLAYPSEEKMNVGPTTLDAQTAISESVTFSPASLPIQQQVFQARDKLVTTALGQHAVEEGLTTEREEGPTTEQSISAELSLSIQQPKTEESQVGGCLQRFQFCGWLLTLVMLLSSSCEPSASLCKKKVRLIATTPLLQIAHNGLMAVERGDFKYDSYSS